MDHLHWLFSQYQNEVSQNGVVIVKRFRRSEKAKAGIGWDYSQFEFELYGVQPTKILCCLKEGTKVFSLKRTCVERI